VTYLLLIALGWRAVRERAAEIETRSETAIGRVL